LSPNSSFDICAHYSWIKTSKVMRAHQPLQ